MAGAPMEEGSLVLEKIAGESGGDLDWVTQALEELAQAAAETADPSLTLTGPGAGGVKGQGNRDAK